MSWIDSFKERAAMNDQLKITIISGIISLAAAVLLSVLIIYVNPANTVYAVLFVAFFASLMLWAIYLVDCVQTGQCKPAAWILSIMSAFAAFNVVILATATMFMAKRLKAAQRLKQTDSNLEWQRPCCGCNVHNP